MTVTINFVIAFHITNVVSAHVSMKSVLCYAILLVGLTLGPGGAGERMMAGYIAIVGGKLLTCFFLCSVNY